MQAADVIVQLMICYICLTMGSNEHLRKFQMTLDMSTGVPKFVFSCIRERDQKNEVEVKETFDDEIRFTTTSVNSEL